MALKDWKKTYEDLTTIVYENKKEWKEIQIDWFKRKGYQISVNNKIKKHTKTMNQALKFAKSYMRKH